MKKVLVFLADGFEECEGLIVVDILRRAGMEVTTASVMERKKITSSHNIELFADMMAADVQISEYDAVVLPGGIPGTPNLAACSVVTDTCVRFAAEGKIVAAICAAPSILGSLGLLRGKRATVYPGMEHTLSGATPVTEDEVVVDGNLITSRSMGTAIPFALTIAAQLSDMQNAKELARSICYEHFA